MLGRTSILFTLAVLIQVYQDSSFQQLLPWKQFSSYTFVGACAIAGVIYAVFVVYPLTRIAKNQLNHCQEGTAPVSVRAELKRRGSWPQAYYRDIVDRYKTTVTKTRL